MKVGTSIGVILFAAIIGMGAGNWMNGREERGPSRDLRTEAPNLAKGKNMPVLNAGKLESIKEGSKGTDIPAKPIAETKPLPQQGDNQDAMPAKPQPDSDVVIIEEEVPQEDVVIVSGFKPSLFNQNQSYGSRRGGR